MKKIRMENKNTLQSLLFPDLSAAEEIGFHLNYSCFYKKCHLKVSIWKFSILKCHFQKDSGNLIT